MIHDEHGPALPDQTFDPKSADREEGGCLAMVAFLVVMFGAIPILQAVAHHIQACR